MRGVRIHGVLLLLALGLAFPTWTRERTRPTDIQGILVWDRAVTDLVTISYRSPLRRIEITRDTRDAEPFLWGSEDRSSPEAPEEETLRFPVGVLGSELMKGYSEFRVLREYKQVDAELKRAFGLVEPSTTITLEFEDGPQVIEVGDSVFGGADRYGWAPSMGTAFVLPSQLLGPLQTGYGALRERQIHYFQGTEVAHVRVQALGRELQMMRTGGGPGTPETWASPDSLGQPNRTFANFMERVSQLAIEGFETPVPPEALMRILRVDYWDDDGESLGFLELQRHVESGTFYLSSERTRVPAQAVKTLADRVDQDLPQIF